MSWFYWVVKKWLYFQGIRFYETKYLPSSAESIRTSFRGNRVTTEDIEVSFEFYREFFQDQFYRRGKFEERSYEVFIVKAHFRGMTDERLLKFNDIKLLCKSSWFPTIPDEVVVDILQGLYIAFIRKHLL